MGRRSLTLLLDTHVLLWWLLDEDSLSRAQSEALERVEANGQGFGVSAITFWEIAKLVECHKLELQSSVDALFAELEANPLLRSLPLTPRIALESTRLGSGFPRDPADQLIVATARVHGLQLVTADTMIRRARVVPVI